MKNSSEIAQIRKEYTQESLDVIDVAADPITQFKKWMDEAIQAELPEPTAMTVSTVTKEGKPHSRILLLKGVDERGMVFFSNYLSEKGEDMAANPFVCLNFFWPELERQVRVEGEVSKISDQESEVYFASRPRGSQIGAWVSPQSQVIESREVLEEKIAEFNAKFEGQAIPKPPHWGGYLLVVDKVEFWQGRPSRLHDRIVYQKNQQAWKIFRVAP
ncbi:MAG: pyridoxamine 5'-phosphate oxidase [Microscillaceae bacterium]|nr:pyridoxamine 5'-phosphate oxidase [Microscillaceae bacterium]